MALAIIFADTNDNGRLNDEVGAALEELCPLTGINGMG